MLGRLQVMLLRAEVLALGASGTLFGLGALTIDLELADVGELRMWCYDFCAVVVPTRKRGLGPVSAGLARASGWYWRKQNSPG